MEYVVIGIIVVIAVVLGGVLWRKVRIPDYSDSISGSIRTIKPDTSGHLVMYFDFT